MSALGGEGVHAMSFAGSEILPTANPAGTSLWLEESNQSGQTPTNWVSHPSGIGYRRSSPGITTSGSGSGSSSTGPPIAGNPVTMDTGMSDGGNQEEINRLSNFITGGNENPTAMQPGPIGRAEQIAMPITPTGSPAAVGFGETTGRDVIGDVMNQQGGGTWTPYGNPLYHPSSASPNAHPSGSERSGATGRGYGNGGYGGPPINSAPPAASPPPPNAAPFVSSLPWKNLSKEALVLRLFIKGPGDDFGEIPPNPLLDSTEGPIVGFISNFDRFSNPLLSVEASGTNRNPIDLGLHYGMQAANVASLADAPVQLVNLGRLGLNGLRAAAGARAGVQGAELCTQARGFKPASTRAEPRKERARF